MSTAETLEERLVRAMQREDLDGHPLLDLAKEAMAKREALMKQSARLSKAMLELEEIQADHEAAMNALDEVIERGYRLLEEYQ